MLHYGHGIDYSHARIMGRHSFDFFAITRLQTGAWSSFFGIGGNNGLLYGRLHLFYHRYIDTFVVHQTHLQLNATSSRHSDHRLMVQDRCGKKSLRLHSAQTNLCNCVVNPLRLVAKYSTADCCQKNLITASPSRVFHSSPQCGLEDCVVNKITVVYVEANNFGTDFVRSIEDQGRQWFP